MNMTRAAAVSMHGVSPDFISIGTTHNLPLCLCEKVITSGREVVLRPCYAGIKQLLRGPAPHSPPRTVEQGSNRASAPQMLQGSTALLLYCFGVRWGSGGGPEPVAHV